MLGAYQLVSLVHSHKLLKSLTEFQVCLFISCSQAEEEAKMKYEVHFASHEKTHMGGFRRIYPNGNEEEYAEFFDQSTSLCAETAASRARSELSKQLREELQVKQKEEERYRRNLGPPSATQPSDVAGRGERDGGEESGPGPESPGRERPRKGSNGDSRSVGIKRRISFRLPLYLRSSAQETHSQTAASPEVSSRSQHELCNFGNLPASVL